jgi:hypothetical protein
MKRQPKYGWDRSEATIHRFIKSVAQDLAKTGLFNETAEEIEAKMHVELQRAREANDQESTT